MQVYLSRKQQCIWIFKYTQYDVRCDTNNNWMVLKASEAEKITVFFPDAIFSIQDKISLFEIENRKIFGYNEFQIECDSIFVFVIERRTLNIISSTIDTWLTRFRILPNTLTPSNNNWLITFRMPSIKHISLRFELFLFTKKC